MERVYKSLVGICLAISHLSCDPLPSLPLPTAKEQNPFFFEGKLPGSERVSIGQVLLYTSTMRYSDANMLTELDINWRHNAQNQQCKLSWEWPAPNSNRAWEPQWAVTFSNPTFELWPSGISKIEYYKHINTDTTITRYIKTGNAYQIRRVYRDGRLTELLAYSPLEKLTDAFQATDGQAIHVPSGNRQVLHRYYNQSGQVTKVDTLTCQWGESLQTPLSVFHLSAPIMESTTQNGAYWTSLDMLKMLHAMITPEMLASILPTERLTLPRYGNYCTNRICTSSTTTTYGCSEQQHTGYDNTTSTVTHQLKRHACIGVPDWQGIITLQKPK